MLLNCLVDSKRQVRTILPHILNLNLGALEKCIPMVVIYDRALALNRFSACEKESKKVDDVVVVKGTLVLRCLLIYISH